MSPELPGTIVTQKRNKGRILPSHQGRGNGNAAARNLSYMGPDPDPPIWHDRIDLILYGLLFAGLILIFDPRLEVQFTLPKLAWFRSIFPLLLFSWVFRLRRGEIRAVPAPVVTAALALMIWWVISTGFSIHVPTALDGMHGRYNGLWLHLSYVVLFLAIASTAISRGQLERMVLLFMVILLVAACFAIAQHFGFHPSQSLGRPVSTIGHPVILAAVLGLGVPFFIGFMQSARGMFRKAGWAVMLVMMICAVGMTRSRGPMLGIAASVLIMLAAYFVRLKSQRHKRLLAAILIGLGCLAAGIIGRTLIQAGGINALVERLESIGRLSADSSVRNRFVFYAAALRMSLDHPVTGVGLECYGLMYPQYRPVEGPGVALDVIPTMVHNGYLQSAATTGLPGLLFYLVLIASVVRFLWRPKAFSNGNDLSLAFGAAIAGYLVQDLSGWLEIPLTGSFWLLLGMALNWSNLQMPMLPWPSSRARKYWTAAAVVPVAGSILFVYPAVKEIHADQLLSRHPSYDKTANWPRVREMITDMLSQAGSNTYYSDRAAQIYFKRLRATGDAEAYNSAGDLLEQAHRLNPLDPYILIHRIDLEALAVARGVKPLRSYDLERAIKLLLEMDPNNPAAYGAIAEFRLAAGAGQKGIDMIRRAVALRPQEGKFWVLEGDLWRSVGSTSQAIQAYREGAARFEAASLDWITTMHKLILNLVEAGSFSAALKECRRLTAQAPKDSMAWMLTGIASRDSGDSAGARLAFSRAVALDPSDETARHALEALR